VPVTRRSRRLGAPVEEVWATVSDPYHLPRWWPRVARVESVEAGAFTQVLKTDKGKSVRADYHVTEFHEPEHCRWVQQVVGTPFEGLFAAAHTEIRLAPEDGATRVTIELGHKLRGMARLGAFMFRGPVRRQIDSALDGLEMIHTPG
jgi:uncharacterized protein YndB with AHSA1/START domain